MPLSNELEALALDAEARIPAAATKRTALEYAIAAAEKYIAATKHADSHVEKARLKSKSKAVLALAERIKQSETWDPSPEIPHQPPRALRPPKSSRNLTTREEVILLESSKLHGFKFPPWKSPPGPGAFEATDGIFEDSSELNLSVFQQEIFDGWKRPLEAFPNPSMDVTPGDVDLVQDVTSDCSVVASLCAATARVKQGHQTLLSGVIYPYDADRRCPLESENGKYIFRFHFNGCFRQVVIDDRLPTSRSARTLHVVDRNHPTLLWPALIEKAYLKVRGGYNFPGSNSGTDLWVITSWIPEQIFLQSDDVRSEQLWQRIFKAYGYGDVLITMGTGRMSAVEERQLNLVGEHDYAVVDLRTEADTRLLLVKNPWCEGALTTPQPNNSSASIWTEGLRAALPTLPKTEPGTFWISFDSVVQNFESLYLNWNPGLFRHRQDHHFSWTIPPLASPESFSQNPQFSVTTTRANTVWILLSRHFKTEEYDILSRSAGTLADAARSLGFISLYAFDTQGQKVYLSDHALLRGPFVDSPQTLLRFELPAGKAYTVVVAQESLPLPKYSFTLSVFSQDALTVSPPVDAYTHHVELSGSWTRDTAGGNSSHASFSRNPQYRVDVPAPTALLLFLESHPADVAVHVELVWSDGARLPAVTNRDIITTSGDYRRGCAVATAELLRPGAYTIIVSTFEPQQLGHFTLRAAATVPIAARHLPAEDAGRLRTPLPPVRFAPGVGRVLAPVTVARLTKVTAVARHLARRPAATTAAGPPSPLRVGLERSQGPNKTVLARSGGGEFADLATGVRCPEVDATPELTRRGGGLWLVVERLAGAQSEETVEVEVLTEMPVDVGVWGTGDG